MLNSYSSTRNYPYYKFIVLVADLLMVNGLYGLACIISKYLSLCTADMADIDCWVTINVFYLICFKLVGVVLFNRIARVENVLARVGRVIIDHFLIIAFLAYIDNTLMESLEIM